MLMGPVIGTGPLEGHGNDGHHSTEKDEKVHRSDPFAKADTVDVIEENHHQQEILKFLKHTAFLRFIHYNLTIAERSGFVKYDFPFSRYGSPRKCPFPSRA